MEDIYYVNLPTAHAIEAWLEQIPANNNYQLYVYADVSGVCNLNGQDKLCGYSGNPGNGDEHIITPVLPAGKYYVRVRPVQGYSATQPYAFRAVYQ